MMNVVTNRNKVFDYPLQIWKFEIGFDGCRVFFLVRVVQFRSSGVPEFWSSGVPDFTNTPYRHVKLFCLK